MIEINNLDYYFGKSQVLKNINISLNKPALIGLLGHNGSGKSTLLKILGASYACQKGEIKLLGVNALDNNNYIKKYLRNKLGIILQETSSDPMLSAYDNLWYFARLMGINSPQDLITNILELADLAHKSSELVKKLSHGMRRRLEIYRSFMHKPKICLLDEPTEGLDFVSSARFWGYVKKYIQEEQAIILLATHRAHELEHCDEIIMLHDGQKIAQKSPNQFLASLDYFKLEITLNNSKSKFWHPTQKDIFYPSSDRPDLLQAQVKQDNLPDLLKNSDLANPAVQSVRWMRPELNDAYELCRRNYDC